MTMARKKVQQGTAPQEQPQDYRDAYPSEFVGAGNGVALVSERALRIALANVYRTLKNLRPGYVSDVAVASRVTGATLKLTREVRAEIDANGVLAIESEGP